MTAVCAAIMLSGMTAAKSQLLFNVSLNTSSLVGNPNGPFSLDFQLTDGSGTNDGNNTAIINNFQFGGGSPTGSPTLSGGGSGGLATAVTLSDSSFFNELLQGFTPGSLLSFDVNLSTNVDAGGTPDELSFAILDGLGNEIPTDGLGALFIVDVNTPSPDVQAFAANAPYEALGSPRIVVAGQGVPEPGIAGLVMSLLAIAGPVAARRMSKS